MNLKETQESMSTSNVIAARDLETMRTAVTGDVFAPGDHGFDEARRAWNLTTDERPAVVVAAGFAGWLAWLFVHVWYLAGLRNRVMALVSWGWYYLRLDRPIRIILQTPPDPIVATLRSLDPGERHAAPAEIGGRTL
jgi:hypothetical protein